MIKKTKVRPFGLKVSVEDGLFEKALRTFRRKVDNSGLIKEIKEREAYIKPSIERKLAKSRAIKRWQKKQRLSRV